MSIARNDAQSNVIEFKRVSSKKLPSPNSNKDSPEYDEKMTLLVDINRTFMHGKLPIEKLRAIRQTVIAITAI